MRFTGLGHSLDNSYLLSFSVAAEGVKYWQSVTTSVFSGRDRWSRAKASDVELNSYALLIYLNRSLIIESQQIANWLMSQRNANGGFSSTQVCTVCFFYSVIHTICSFGFFCLASIILEILR